MKRGNHLFIGLFAGGMLATPACTGDEVTGGDDDHAVLHIESADAESGLRATITVDGELITVTSVTQDGVRDTSVVGEGGVSYAEWHSQVSDLNTHGSYGERTFGRVEDRETDGDTAGWAEVLDSRVGQVLESVSSAAAAAAAEDDPGIEAVTDELTAVSRIHPSLAALAQVEDPDASAYDNGCWFGNGSHDLSAYCSEGYYYLYAWTSRPNGTCTRTYSVQIYKDQGGTYVCGDGTGDGSWWKAECWRTPLGVGFRSFTSKHWDSLNPGSPHWRNKGVVCN